MADDASVGVRGLRRDFNWPVIQPLVGSFVVIVGDELSARSLEMALAQRYDPIETLRLDREDEPLREGIQIGAPRRQADDLHAAAFGAARNASV